MTLAEDLAPEIVRRRAAGESVRKIANALDVGRGTVDRALRAAGVLVSKELMKNPEPETPAGPSGSSASGSSPDVPSSPEGPATSSPTERYASRFAGFVSSVREVLEDEQSKLIRQAVEGLLADFEARSQQSLRALDLKIRKRAQDRAGRPDRERKLLDGLAKELANAEARLAEAERTAASVTTEHGRRRARRQVEHEREKLDNVKQVIAWREGQLERAEAACS